VKRLVFETVTDETTRLTMGQAQQADIAQAIGVLAEGIKGTPGLTLKATLPEWVVFTEQWDPKSPWVDQRVRLAGNLAIDRKSINEAEYLGFGKISAIQKTTCTLRAVSTRVSSKRASSKDHRDTRARRSPSRLSARRMMARTDFCAYTSGRSRRVGVVRKAGAIY
jgi:ABC-type transport system substrate-binding protein